MDSTAEVDCTFQKNREGVHTNPAHMGLTPPQHTHTQMPNCGHLKQSANEPTVKGPITKGHLCSNLEH